MLARHRNQAKPPVTHLCNSCGITFKHKEGYEKRVSVVHEGTRFGCPVCQKVFYWGNAVRRHLLKFHHKDPKEVKNRDFLVLKTRSGH